MNKFMVGSYADGIQVLGAHRLMRPITREDALNLAAWLVAIADPASARCGSVTSDPEPTAFEKALKEACSS